MAGVEGIEPSSGVLETLILPMNYTPLKLAMIFYNIFLPKSINIIYFLKDFLNIKKTCLEQAYKIL